MYSTLQTTALRSLSQHLAAVDAGASATTCVTNWFGGTRRAPSQRGHGDLVMPEFSVITDRFHKAIETGEDYTAVIVVQDFKKRADYTLGRLEVRDDDKYLEQKMPAKVEYACEEIETFFGACDHLAQLADLHPNVAIDLRITTALICYPAAFSDSGSVAGSYSSNQSDFLSPAYFYGADTEDYKRTRDHCEKLVRKSIQAIGASPDKDAASLVRLAMNPKELRAHFMDRIENDPIMYADTWVDRREIATL